MALATGFSRVHRRLAPYRSRYLLPKCNYFCKAWRSAPFSLPQRDSISVIRAGQAIGDRALPLAKFHLELVGLCGFAADEIGFLRWVGFKIEEFTFGGAVRLLVHDQFEMAVDDCAGAKVIGVRGQGLAEVFKV